MNQPADVPIPPDLSRRYSGSVQGRDWLAPLPRLVSQCFDRWQLGLDLAPDALPWNGHGHGHGHGHGAIVVPVRRRGDTAAGQPPS
ncbi:hypothetical protein [Arthrobacter sp. UYCu712]|uniref:hypothetical protein n=1 Tax=Arthrobacter sp. UYCu712 TaxID=3156340 RepID=UPI003394F54A